MIIHSAFFHLILTRFLRGKDGGSSGEEGTQGADHLIQRPAHIHRRQRIVSDPLGHKSAVDQRVDRARKDGKHDRDQRSQVFPAQKTIIPHHAALIRHIRPLL